MELLNFTQPIALKKPLSDHKIALSLAFKSVFEQEFQQKMQDLVDYGCPHIGSPTVVERFTKQDGLVVLRRPLVADAIMRVIYANWLSMPSERGLAFIEFVLNMLWEDSWSITRVWHSIAKANEYPRYLVASNQPIENHFLTSRIHLTLNADIDLKEVVELSPIVKRMVPANICAKVISEGLNKQSQDISLALGAAAKVINFVDLS